MRPALDVIWETVLDWYNGMVGLVTMNLIWLVASLTVILMPPATAGLYVVTNDISLGTGAHFADYAAGARLYAWVSWRWAAVNILVVFTFVINFMFYGATETFLGVLVQVTLATVGLLWIAVQFYVWPFLIVQKEKHLRTALKNALFLTLANPVYTVLLLSMAGLALVLSLVTMLPLAVFATSFISLLGNRAVIERLKTYHKLPGSPPLSGDE